MKKEAFWKKDWFLGLAITVLFVAMAAGRSPLGSLERFAYDLGARFSSRDAGDDVVVLRIDDNSINSIGRWPWSRAVLADMFDRLADAGARVVASTVFLSEPQVDPGLARVRDLARLFEDVETDPETKARYAAALASAEADLDTDSRLAGALEGAGNVVLPMYFALGEPIGNPDEPLPESVLRFAIPEDNVRFPEGMEAPLPAPTNDALPPISAFASDALGIGHLINPPDVDGKMRFEPLVVSYYGTFFPSESLMIAAASLNLGVEDIRINLGESVELGNLSIRTDPFLNMLTFYYADQGDGSPAFPGFSFYDVLVGNVSPEAFRDKIVIIGATASGLGINMFTPLGETRGAVNVMAHNVASILNEDFFIEPPWGIWVRLAAFLVIAAYLIAVLPRLKAGTAALLSLVLFAALIGAEIGLLTSNALWLKLMTPAALLLIGHVLLTTKRFLVTEAGKLRADADSAMSNRALALQYQGDGKLDMAFDYFRKCPLDDQIKENIYNLALDYERKRQFAKALNAYNYIADTDPDFRDIKDKIRRAKSLEETVLIGGSGSGPGPSLLTADGVSKPTLGKFEIEKELGKGAMGIVYLGRDPKINRTVAIKTMALSQEFEEDELDEVKSRFFREAETAGNLSHPNIVNIYDVGEEHDLAYIAMEFLEGHDLTRYTKPDNLLPLPTVMGVIFKACQALDVAHKNNVVHRDIKPANIMFEPESKQVKLTDFGIARITDSSRTKTGMVLGTPSYMSPEQLSGKKVDGRSDLFSLGVTFYQLLTGKLPFKGDSMATLMYKIANEAHPDLRQARPELIQKRPCLSAIIDKALQKDVDQRYQSGLEMARDIQRCAKGA